MKYLRTLLWVCGIAVTASLHGQKRNTAYQQYIDKYNTLAVEQMRRHKIPASITLAQALLESGAGNSYLATKANNHFGIKVGMGWTGSYVTRDDDYKNERFRKYKNVSESYEDHSLFLQQARYKRLFDLDPTDYKGWARGLKACGYATLPTYADRLISIIDTYELHQYDEDRHGLRQRRKQPEPVAAPVVIPHLVSMVNGKACIVWRSDDTWDALAKETGISRRKLLAFNEVDKTFEPVAGTNIFLQKKGTKAAAEYKGVWHKVKVGESMYSIAQLYGIRLKNLYKMNYKDGEYIPVPGDLLKIR